MGWKENKINYIKSYYKSHYHKYVVAVNVETEPELDNWLKSQKRMTTYIKDLIKKDMNLKKVK